MLIEHWAPIEADFRRFYQLDLPAAIFGANPVSARQFGSLVQALPVDSALARALDPDHQEWRNTEELLAILAEVSHATYRLLWAVNTKPNTPRPEPLEIPRPGQQGRAYEPRSRRASSAEIAAFFGAGQVVYVSEEER